MMLSLDFAIIRRAPASLARRGLTGIDETVGLLIVAGLAQQDEAVTKKELEDARADLERAAKRLADLSRGSGDLRMPINIDTRIVSRPRLGVLLSGDNADGVRITGVTPDSGAARAGLKAGDRLLRVGQTARATLKF